MVILTEFGLSPSSPSRGPNHRYEVFLSFRGVDTRNSFTDHLYNTLLDANISTFLDDEEIETGDTLKPELECAIKSSRASIIVLSKNYASSTWCLDELVLILDQKRKFNQIVIPIFYHVEPTHVRKQQNSFGDAMAKHKRRMDDETDAKKKSELAQKMELWKTALAEVADLKGKDSKGRKETDIIKELVTDIHRRFGVPLSNALPHLIGVSYYIDIISSWLTDGSCHTIDILTVVGMSGIGKTSLAKYVFQLHSSKFYKSSFIEGINTRCNERFDGLLDLQKQLHGDISKNIPLKVNDVSVYTAKIEKALTREKVFIVLDDIASLNQLDALLGNKGLHPGSKIIITAMDASLTERCALFKSQLHPNHLKISLYGLNDDESLKLLCIHAFESHKPKEGYKWVSKKLVKYCKGHPLALEVLGQLLHKRDVSYWEECVKGLKKEPHSGIKKVFRMSFDSLPSNDMELFLHIACFFVGNDRDLTETILNACDIETRSGITNLTERCLLSIGWNEHLMMHSLIQHMGRDLVRQQSLNKPWKRNRLWCHEESFKVLKQENGKGNLLGLALDMRILDKKKSHGSFELKTKSLSKMNNLMLLQLNYVQMNGSYEDFPEELRWLCMHESPLKSIPLDLPMENLVALDLSYSNIEFFDMSKGKKLLGSLKILDLSFCEHLHSVGGFLELPALERFIVRKCISLIEVCESVEQCVELVHVDMSYCYKLKKVPISIGKLKKVKTLLLDGCSSRESQIGIIPRDLKLITFSLPSSLRILSLANNNLSNESFPNDFISLSMLQKLHLDYNPFVSMPGCVRSLPRLEILSMNGCERVISIEYPPRTLRELSINFPRNTFLRKIKFDPEMTPLKLNGARGPLAPCSFETDGMVKIQAMTRVEENVLHSLGWTNLDFTKERRMRTRTGGRSLKYQTQMYYEFGIFSTIYEGEGMPDWMRLRSKGPSISFTIPSSPNKIRGLNFCFTVEKPRFRSYVKMPWINIKNITKDHDWTYCHYASKWKLVGKCYTLLSHWMFGPNEMEGGDQVTITVRNLFYSDNAQPTRECGISGVFDEDGKIKEGEEDVLSYYKAWNHIIGGDLSPFQVMTGVYVLDNFGGSFEGDQNFKAFS